MFKSKSPEQIKADIFKMVESSKDATKDFPAMSLEYQKALMELNEVFGEVMSSNQRDNLIEKIEAGNELLDDLLKIDL